MKSTIHELTYAEIVKRGSMYTSALTPIFVLKILSSLERQGFLSISADAQGSVFWNPIPKEQQPDPEKLVTVCSQCRTASCFLGRNVCKDEDGTCTKLHVRILQELDAEHHSMWKTDEEVVAELFLRS